MDHERIRVRWKYLSNRNILTLGLELEYCSNNKVITVLQPNISRTEI